MLRIWLELCSGHGVTEVLINTHHLSEEVEKYFRAKSAPFVSREHAADRPFTFDFGGLRVTLSYEPVLLGSAGTLLFNRGFVEGERDFFILYADNLTNVNLTQLMNFHRSHGDLLTMGLFLTDKPGSCGIAELDENGRIMSFEEKPNNPKTNLAAAGVYIASPSIFEFFPAGPGLEKGEFTAIDLGFHIFPRLVGRMYGYLIHEYLLDIGDFDSYGKAQKNWARETP